MYEELDRLIREYIRMGYTYKDARDAAVHEYKAVKNIKGGRKTQKPEKQESKA